MDFKRLCSNIERELTDITDKGLSSSNLDNAYKLMTMYKDIKKVESGMYDKGGSYSDGAYASRHRDSLGRYTHNAYRGGLDDKYNSYLDSKSAYRANNSFDAKSDVVHKLEEYMDSFANEMEDMLRDSDTPEERQTIQRYLNKIRAF